MMSRPPEGMHGEESRSDRVRPRELVYLAAEVVSRAAEGMSINERRGNVGSGLHSACAAIHLNGRLRQSRLRLPGGRPFLRTGVAVLLTQVAHQLARATCVPLFQGLAQWIVAQVPLLSVSSVERGGSVPMCHGVWKPDDD